MQDDSTTLQPVANLATTETAVKPSRRELNAARHGLGIKRLSLGSLPKKWSNVVRQCSAFRKMLEDAVVGLRGSVTLVDACAIQTACKWERHAMLAQKWLRDNPDLAPMERLEFAKEITRASESRDRYVKSLGLADLQKPKNPWDALNALPDPAAVPSVSISATGQPGAREGATA